MTLALATSVGGNDRSNEKATPLNFCTFFWSRETGSIPVTEYGMKYFDPTVPQPVIHMILLRPADERVFVRLANKKVRISEALVYELRPSTAHEMRDLYVTGYTRSKPDPPGYPSGQVQLSLSIGRWLFKPSPSGVLATLLRSASACRVGSPI
jgi:hypothetical protein